MSENCSWVAAAISREGGDGRSHHRRIRDLYDLCRCLSLLLGEKSDGADSARSPRNADLLHDLLVVQQLDHSFSGEVSGTRHCICFPWTLAAQYRAWGIVPLWHSAGMAPTDLRTRADDFDQPFRDN